MGLGDPVALAITLRLSDAALIAVAEAKLRRIRSNTSTPLLMTDSRVAADTRVMNDLELDYIGVGARPLDRAPGFYQRHGSTPQHRSDRSATIAVGQVKLFFWRRSGDRVATVRRPAGQPTGARSS